MPAGNVFSKVCICVSLYVSLSVYIFMLLLLSCFTYDKNLSFQLFQHTNILYVRKGQQQGQGNT